MTIHDYGLLVEGEKPKLCLKGDTEGIENLIEKYGVSIASKIDQSTIAAAIVRDEILFVDTDGVDIICLINFNLFKADEACRYSGSRYVFNFKDEVSCTEFLVGYYYAKCYQLGNLDIRDIYYSLGHRENQKGLIKSVFLNQWRENLNSPGMVSFNFSNGAEFLNNNDVLLDIHLELKNNKHREVALLEFSQETIELNFSRILTFEEGCKCIRMW